MKGLEFVQWELIRYCCDLMWVKGSPALVPVNTSSEKWTNVVDEMSQFIHCFVNQELDEHLPFCPTVDEDNAKGCLSSLWQWLRGEKRNKLKLGFRLKQDVLRDTSAFILLCNVVLHFKWLYNRPSSMILHKNSLCSEGYSRVGRYTDGLLFCNTQ